MALSDSLRKQFDDLIAKNKVVLFMKGNKHFPQCGFSAQVVGILKDTGVPFETVNVLSDPAVRDGIKEYSNWPTIPQLYVNGEFIGGCDIVKEMYAQGDLQTKLGVRSEPVAAPAVTLDDGAAREIASAAEQNKGEFLRFDINETFQYDLYFGERKPGDLEVTAKGVTLLFDPASAKRANGIHVSWVSTADGGAFKIDNPNEPARVKPLAVNELKQWFEERKHFELIDVRGNDERAIAMIQNARMLDSATETHLMSLDKASPIVFQCHHGRRSRSAAERFVREGFTNIYNLEGGIDAWSVHVDPNVPRY